ARAKAVLEGNGSSKTFAEEAFPRRDIGHRGNGKRVEESTHTESQGDGAHVILVPEIRVRFLRVLGHRLEARHEIGNDLQCKQYRQKWVCMEWRKGVSGSTASAAHSYEWKKYEKNRAGHDPLKGRAESYAAIVEEGKENSETNPEDKPRQEDGIAADLVQLERID